MASKRRPPCRCCRHELPHCKCRIDRKPRPKPMPVKTQPERCQLTEFMSLFEIAYSIWVASKKTIPVTSMMVSGAIRSIGLKHVMDVVKTEVHGVVVFRQQTMVHKSRVTLIQKYIEGNNK